MKSKIGILGGTFDPIHNGHLQLAESAYNEFGLEKVIFIPTGVSYMKSGVSQAHHRYEMCSLAISSFPYFEIDDEEIKREGNTYTFETLRYLNSKYPDAEICFIIGLDTLYSIETWKNIKEVFHNCTFLCANRLSRHSANEILLRIQELEKKYSAKIKVLNMDVYPISSTEIRNAYNNVDQESVLCYLPDLVSKYISENHLYSQTEYLKKEMQVRLKPQRYLHTLGVYETAVKLARIYGVDVQKAAISALLHDCAKNMHLKEMNKICAEYPLLLTEYEKESAALLHGKAGAVIAQTVYDIKDDDIFDAIYYHTTGKPDMGLLLQIIFVADYIEPGRKNAPNLTFLRELAETDINRATAIILQDTLAYLESKSGQKTDEMTQKAFDFYKRFL